MTTTPNSVINQMPHFCEIKITGLITSDPIEPTKLQLVTADGCQFRVGKFENQELDVERNWLVSPLTNSTGEITKVQILGTDDRETIDRDSFICQGEVIQVSKKTNLVSAFNCGSIS